MPQTLGNFMYDVLRVKSMYSFFYLGFFPIGFSRGGFNES